MEIGSKKIAMIAGPCSVETEEQIVSIAEDVKKSGAGFFERWSIQTKNITIRFPRIEI